MSVAINFDSPLRGQARRDQIFGGHLLFHQPHPAVDALCEHARKLTAAAFAGFDPQRAQDSMEVSDFVARIAPLKTKFTNDATTKELVRAVLVAFHYDLESTYFDVPRIRIVTSGGYLTAGVGYAYKPHRDTWYASPGYQINWWTPIFDLTAERSMAFYPRYFSEAVKNSSSDFDYAEWCSIGRQQAVSQTKVDTRKHPLPLQTISVSDELRSECRASTMVMFSAAQLHQTVPNTSGLTRFSLDFRTIDRADIESGRGAVNVDSAARGSTLGDFLHAVDFAPIPPALVEKGNTRP